MGKLFGTDGIRGLANEYPMTSEMAMKVGRAVAYFFGRKKGNRSKIIIGKDTRISGYMLEYALVSGVCSMGADACLAGVLPTPGIAYITASTDADAGIVISASHNPFYDNGIKIFNRDGFKLSDEKEAEIESILLGDEISSISRNVRMAGGVYRIDDAGQNYIDFLLSKVQENFCQGMRIVIDCSNGATYKVAPELFFRLGAEVETLFNDPDGKNINENCGSENTSELRKIVLEKRADIGLAFDGDGDRLIAVDEKGNIITGDKILAICAKIMKKKDQLKNNTVVSTVMSNMGLGIALEDMGIKNIKAKVGDRYVLASMIHSGAVLGGEDSGHMIFLDHQTTGDGILTALKLLEALKDESKPLSELSKIMDVFPQVLINVEVKNKPDILSIPKINETIKAVEKNLAEKGRVLVRYSGTQPLCRVMVEGPTLKLTKKYCQEIADKVKEHIG
ncbi:MAG: phosphoglucosamine mutase [Proteobacteria bacterium]|nr:phosphoglucosamine mutase [Desulfobacteraceae bacterium]MBU3980002.1 phosphoglucosamine mutase [Pseudomonadota bacterium]MBU4014408.1 phosphoglucosamine mutase [Pseudomonadota bacterium]MBU4068163.1 phosphoglucosamine mutase [Pseudomonadota bacterium]MBU4127389.1 phosphoglucosamine mutase [Pseudomonadota bacterium]